MGEATSGTVEQDSCIGLRGPAVEDAFDAFNEDLVWILDKLVNRTAGAFGLLTGWRANEPQMALLARSSEGAEVSPDLLDALSDLSREPESHDPRMFAVDRAPVVSSRALHTRDADEIKLIQLTFAPAPGVLLTAWVCRARGLDILSGLHESAATRLYPVLSRYLRLWWLHRVERRRARNLSAALELSDVGVMLLDRRGELVFTNEAAAALLRRAQGLRRQCQTLIAEHPSDRSRLYGAVQSAIHANRCGDGADPTVSFAIRRPVPQRPLIVTITHLPRVAVDPSDAAVIVYALDPDQGVEAVLDPICAIYGLTATETRLVYHLVSGARLVDAADQMQIKPMTARAYLKQIFSKTRTHRQAELVRVMLASAVRMTARTIHHLS